MVVVWKERKLCVLLCVMGEWVARMRLGTGAYVVVHARKLRACVGLTCVLHVFESHELVWRHLGKPRRARRKKSTTLHRS